MLVFVFVCDSLVFPVLRVIYLFCLFFSSSIHINTIQVKVYRMGETVRDTQLCIYTTTLRDGFLLCYALFCLSSLRIRMLVFFCFVRIVSSQKLLMSLYVYVVKFVFMLWLLLLLLLFSVFTSI